MIRKVELLAFSGRPFGTISSGSNPDGSTKTKIGKKKEERKVEVDIRKLFLSIIDYYTNYESIKTF